MQMAKTLDHLKPPADNVFPSFCRSRSWLKTEAWPRIRNTHSLLSVVLVRLYCSLWGLVHVCLRMIRYILYMSCKMFRRSMFRCFFFFHFLLVYRCKKTNEEKQALNAMIQSLEKEGCKVNRLLKVSCFDGCIKLSLWNKHVLIFDLSDANEQ